MTDTAKHNYDNPQRDVDNAREETKREAIQRETVERESADWNQHSATPSSAESGRK